MALVHIPVTRCPYASMDMRNLSSASDEPDLRSNTLPTTRTRYGDQRNSKGLRHLLLCRMDMIAHFSTCRSRFVHWAVRLFFFFLSFFSFPFHLPNEFTVAFASPILCWLAFHIPRVAFPSFFCTCLHIPRVVYPPFDSPPNANECIAVLHSFLNAASLRDCCPCSTFKPFLLYCKSSGLLPKHAS